MRTAILSCTLVFLVIILSLVLFTVYGQNTRQNELEDSLDIAIEQALENLKTRQAYSIDNTDEFVADFVENLIIYIESDSDVKVEILNVDIEKGLLDVNVVETFEQPNGSIKSISCRKTVIMEEYTDAPIIYHQVRFMTTEDGSNVDYVEYKTFTLSEGSFVIIPSESPKKEGYTFKGWSYTKPDASNVFSPELISVSEIDGKLAVQEDIVFYAVFDEN